MKSKQDKPRHITGQKSPEEESIILGLREADRFYQGFQRQGNLGKLIEQVEKKLAHQQGNPPSATAA